MRIQSLWGEGEAPVYLPCLPQHCSSCPADPAAGHRLEQEPREPPEDGPHTGTGMSWETHFFRGPWVAGKCWDSFGEVGKDF